MKWWTVIGDSQSPTKNKKEDKKAVLKILENVIRGERYGELDVVDDGDDGGEDDEEGRRRLPPPSETPRSLDGWLNYWGAVRTCTQQYTDRVRHVTETRSKPPKLIQPAGLFWRVRVVNPVTSLNRQPLTMTRSKDSENDTYCD
jgi:hypothetical protein